MSEHLQNKIDYLEKKLKDLRERHYYNFSSWVNGEVEDFLSNYTFEETEEEALKEEILEKMYNADFEAPCYNADLLGYAMDNLYLRYNEGGLKFSNIYEVISYNIVDSIRDKIQKDIDFIVEKILNK